MELNVSQEVVAINEVVFEDCMQVSVDCDFLLPDYCPDIARILKCQLRPVILSKQLTGDRLVVEGISVASLIYVSDDSKGIRCADYSAPFSCAFMLGDTPENAMFRVKANLDFINCRALSPRRVDIKGVVNVCAKVWSNKKEEIISGVDGANVELLKKSVPISTPIGFAERTFKVQEDLELSGSKPAIANIIKCDAVATLSDYKVISNKVIAKGEAVVHTLYAAEGEEGEPEVMEHSIPISQIIDLEGASEDCLCDAQFEVVSVAAKPELNGQGESKMVSVDIGIMATAKADMPAQIDVISDAFSTKYEAQVESKPTRVERHIDSMADNYLCKNTLDLPETGVSKIIDLWCDAGVTNVRGDGKCIVIFGKLDVAMLALDNEGMPTYLERSLDFEYRHDLKEEYKEVRCEPNVQVLSCGYSLIGLDKIEVRAELKMQAGVYEVAKYNIVSSIAIDEEKPKAKDHMPALTIYYADDGERVWEIAKRYNTSVDAILRENELEETDALEKRMLLIPMAY